MVNLHFVRFDTAPEGYVRCRECGANCLPEDLERHRSFHDYWRPWVSYHDDECDFCRG